MSNTIVSAKQVAKEWADIINKQAKTLPKKDRKRFYDAIGGMLSVSLGKFPKQKAKK